MNFALVVILVVIGTGLIVGAVLGAYQQGVFGKSKKSDDSGSSSSSDSSKDSSSDKGSDSGSSSSSSPSSSSDSGSSPVIDTPKQSQEQLVPDGTVTDQRDLSQGPTTTTNNTNATSSSSSTPALSAIVPAAR